MSSLRNINAHLLDPFSIFDDFITFRPETKSMRPSFWTEAQGDRHCVQVIAPGYEEKDLNISIKDGLLIVTGHHEKSQDDKGVHSEISSFEQSWTLPNDVLTDQIEAEWKAGILTISLPRKTFKQLEVKSIPIKALGP